MAWDRGRTAKWLVLSIAITLTATLLLWHFFGATAFFGFLFLPFLPVFFRSSRMARREALVQAVARRVCPACGYLARDASDRFCPRDASALV